MCLVCTKKIMRKIITLLAIALLPLQFSEGSILAIDSFIAERVIIDTIKDMEKTGMFY